MLTTDTPALTRDQVELLKRTICKGSTDDELALFMQICKNKGLDPFSGEIHAVKRWDATIKAEVMRYQIGIDGYRLIAERTGQRRGEGETLWCGENGAWRNVWTGKEPPLAARVTVFRGDPASERCPLTYTGQADYSFYCQRKRDGTPTTMWARGAAHMLAKCAESLALRKAFPAQLAGLHTTEELGQADRPSVQGYSPPALPEHEPTLYPAEVPTEYESVLQSLDSAPDAETLATVGLRCAAFEGKTREVLRDAYRRNKDRVERATNVPGAE